MVTRGVVVEQVRQEDDWDCGLACVEMLMRWLHRVHPCVFHIDSNRIQAQLRKAMPSQSIWSIDLVASVGTWTRQAIERAAVDVQVDIWFASMSLQANPVHASHPYYSTDYAADVARVAPLYAAWRDLSFHGHVSTAKLKARMLRKPSVLIALVDANELQCCVWKKHRSTSFQGHFILVTSIGDDTVRYVDPATPDHAACVVDVASFDKARCHPSTDQDLVLVSIQ